MAEPIRKPRAFFAYASRPSSIGESVRSACQELNRTSLVTARTWEEMHPVGQDLISEICREIDACDIFGVDLTSVNPNVMFELGYAIGRQKRIWPIIDPTLERAKRDFEQLRTLTTLGYRPYTNYGQITRAFLDDLNTILAAPTFFQQTIEPNLSSQPPSGLLYLKNRHETNAEVKLAKRVLASPVPRTIDDPRESATQTLTWYGQQVHAASSVLCHMANPDREGAVLHNAKYALVAGMAHAVDRHLLMLAEGAFAAPLDYRDLLLQYETAQQALDHLERWISTAETRWREQQSSLRAQQERTHQASRLKDLRLGEPVAENELEDLVGFYFLETQAYTEALEGRQTIFVGRKGAGKTAIFLKMQAALSTNRQNLVCPVMPVSYDLSGVFTLLSGLGPRSQKTYAIEALWKFLLVTEMAAVARARIESSVDTRRTSVETEFLEFMRQHEGLMQRDFSTRLDSCLSRMLPAIENSERTTSPAFGNLSGAQDTISETIHGGVYKELRLHLGKLLASKKRVAVIIDNLDKAWNKRDDLTAASEFLLGVLSAANRIRTDFSKSDDRREAISLNVVVFLRLDIFEHVKRAAREPDKLKTATVVWSDPEVLFRVVEERLAFLHDGTASGPELWHRYFCPTVSGSPSRDYFLTRSLPRPRDLVFFVKASLATAINRRHSLVEESDILAAEKQYSQFALDSILVEDDGSFGSLEAIVYEFAGCPAIQTQSEVESILSRCSMATEAVLPCIEYLTTLSFLGVEVAANDFRFAEDPLTRDRDIKLAQRWAAGRGHELRYQVHPAFWPFLEIPRP